MTKFQVQSSMRPDKQRVKTYLDIIKLNQKRMNTLKPATAPTPSTVTQNAPISFTSKEGEPLPQEKLFRIRLQDKNKNGSNERQTPGPGRPSHPFSSLHVTEPQRPKT